MANKDPVYPEPTTPRKPDRMFILNILSGYTLNRVSSIGGRGAPFGVAGSTATPQNAYGRANVSFIYCRITPRGATLPGGNPAIPLHPDLFMKKTGESPIT
jgi:hypothetical protein